MWILRHGLILCIALFAQVAFAQTPPAQDSQNANPQSVQTKAEQLFALANEARAASGVGPLKWDPALAAAALQHCMRMASEGPISHRYAGEPDLTARTGQAGAHFSLIEENIAVGSYIATIHQGWLDSPEHRANLLNPDVDSVGVAVVAAGGVIFAVADYARTVATLTQDQVEAVFAGMLRARGLVILKDTAEVRAYCASSSHFEGQDPPSFLTRWQSPDVARLPRSLEDRVESGEYRQAAVGSCPPQDVQGAFTVYRVAVFLYGPGSVIRARPFYQPND